MKVCSKCKIPQPLENFKNGTKYKDGKNPQCKLCDKKYREENKNRIAVKMKRYRACIYRV